MKRLFWRVWLGFSLLTVLLMICTTDGSALQEVPAPVMRQEGVWVEAPVYVFFGAVSGDKKSTDTIAQAVRMMEAHSLYSGAQGVDFRFVKTPLSKQRIPPGLPETFGRVFLRMLQNGSLLALLVLVLVFGWLLEWVFRARPLSDSEPFVQPGQSPFRRAAPPPRSLK